MSEPKVAVVTGANRGIGFEVCRQLAELGMMRVVLTSRNAAKGDAAVAKLAATGVTVTWRELDVTREASIHGLAEWLAGDLGGVDILVNNAGIVDPKGARVLTTSSATLQDVLATNLVGPYLMCKALVPLMQARQYGRIVNLSSGLGQLAEMGAGTPAYRVSKAALNALTRTLAAELGGTNVLVNSMCPGWVRTDMGGPNALSTVEQGADTAIWLATLPKGGPTGGFFRDRKPIPW